MQSLLSQLHGMSAETKGLAAPAANDPDSASMINEIHRNQHETLQVLQNMVEAISKLGMSDTVDPLLKQRMILGANLPSMMRQHLRNY